MKKRIISLLFLSSRASAFLSVPVFGSNRFNRSNLLAYTDHSEFGISSSMNVDLSTKSNISNQRLHPFKLSNGGRITMVGSGPGDPDLLTLAAFKLLSDPNALVISDRLVSKEILDLIEGECKIARKLPGCAEEAQEEIYKWCKEGLDAGKHVIRLKIGDPFVFGRGGEEVLKFREYGVEPKVIPGVSAAFSAPLLGSIPVTHRGVSSQVVMCTGYGRDGSSPDLIQYHKEQTIVFLMAVGRLRDLCRRLIDLAGYPSKTPVGIIQNAGCPNQRTVVGNMETIADLAEKYQVKAPSTIVVGEVVNVLLEEDIGNGEELVGLINSVTETV
jgi:uroporphyrin-III C-methyltransferase